MTEIVVSEIVAVSGAPVVASLLLLWLALIAAGVVGRCACGRAAITLRGTCVACDPDLPDLRDRALRREREGLEALGRAALRHAGGRCVHDWQTFRYREASWVTAEVLRRCRLCPATERKTITIEWLTG